MLRVFFFLLLSYLCAFSHAQTIGDSASKPAIASYAAPLHVLQGLSINSSIDQVAALAPERFETFNPLQLYALTPETALWLRLALNPPGQAGQWQLQFPTVIVDRYEFYQRDGLGRWQMSAAGDRVAHSQWPLDSLRPSFALPDATAAAQFVYVRIVHQLPLNLAPVLVQTETALRRDSTQMLWVGLLVGVVFTLLLTCLQMSISYRDWTYCWYAAYLFFSMFAALCYSGIAQSLLWPNATKFASDAIVMSVMAAYIFNLQFCRAMFGSLQRPVFHVFAKLLMALCGFYIALTLWSHHYNGYIVAFHMLSLGVFVFIISSAFYAWRRGVVYGGYWLLVYLPYLCAVGLTLAQSAGLVSAEFPAELPIAAIMLEAVAMMLCLNGHSRLRHTQAVRERMAARRDPLTGFLNAQTFRTKAMQIWNASSRLQSDVTLAYVQVTPADTLQIEPMDVEALMARSVRVVRTAVREFDTVGRVGRQRLAIVMADMPPGNALNGRLSRLVALGLMRDSLAEAGETLKFTITVGVRSQFSGSFEQLERALANAHDSAQGDRKVISYVRKE